MARVTVPAQRAVRGDFPAVCVRTGLPASGTVAVVDKVGGVRPWAFLLVLAGPVGWIVLIGLALALGEDFEVQLPFASDAWNAIRRTTAAGSMILGAAGVAFLSLLLMDQSRAAVIVGAGVAVVGLIVVSAARAMLPRVSLDATRTSATIRRAHRGFCDAVRAESAAPRLR